MILPGCVRYTHFINQNKHEVILKKIITHGGVFHADDVMACAIVKRIYSDATFIIRREPRLDELSNPNVIKLDVGGVFNITTASFDHHQRGGAGTRGTDSLNIPYATAGLVWNFLMTPLEQDVIRRVDFAFIRWIDAVDCGWRQAGVPCPRDGLSFSQTISWLNPSIDAGDAERDKAFFEAVDLGGIILRGAINNAQEWLAGKDVVLKANTINRHILLLDKFALWYDHIYTRPDQAELLYIVFPNSRDGYTVQQINMFPGSFTGRKPLPKNWAGLKGKDFEDVTGVSDAIFCHPNRFCAAAKTVTGAVKLAQLALDNTINLV